MMQETVEKEMREVEKHQEAKVKDMLGRTVSRQKVTQLILTIRLLRIHINIGLKQKRSLTLFVMLEPRSVLRGVSLLGKREQLATVQSKALTLPSRLSL